MEPLVWDEDWLRRKAWGLSTSLDDFRFDVGRYAPAEPEELVVFLRLPAAEAIPLPLLDDVVEFVQSASTSQKLVKEVENLARAIRAKRNLENGKR